MGYTFKETRNIVLTELSEQARKVQIGAREVLNIPIIVGPVGTGKTSLTREVAAELGLDIIKINCGENGDPADVAGMAVPWALEKVGKNVQYMQHVLNEELWRATEKGVLLFFDDIDKMEGIVQGALLGIMGERVARGRKLHKETLVMGAGNRVQDDRLAHNLSESLKTRATILELSATLTDFAEFAKEHPTEVHPTVLGYLQYRPAHLHQQRDDVPRFATQRGWVEASSLMFQKKADEPYPGKGHHAWKTIIDLKCGAHIGSDFWAWYSIVARVNVERILSHGDIEVRDLTDKEKEDFMFQYAAIFAVAQHLNLKRVSATYVGLEPFVNSLAPEMRVALLVQLTPKAREQVHDVLPKVASTLLMDLISI